MPELTIEEFKTDPYIKSLPGAEQQRLEQILTQETWEETKASDSYKWNDRKGRQKIKDEFDARHPMGKAVHFEEDNADNGFFKNTLMQVGYGAQDTWDALQSADDASTGNFDADLAGRVTKQANRLTYSPAALKKAEAAMAAETKRFKHAKGFWESAGALAHTAGATLHELFTNPAGTTYLGARSLTNAIPSMVAGGIGFMAPIPGGTAAGQAAGSYLTESGSYLLESIRNEVTRQGLPVTEENVKRVLSDQKTREMLASKARRKGVGTALVDTVFSVGAGKVASAPLRAARKQAAEKLGKGATQESIDIAAHLLTKNRSKLQKAANAAKVVGIETLSEPISEGAGTLLAGDGIDAGGLMGETLGGVAAGPLMAPIDTALHSTKLAAKASSKAIKEARREKSAEELKLKKLTKSPTQHKYNEKAEKIATDDAVDTVIDPESESYDPHLGVKAMVKQNTQEEVSPATKLNNIDRARKIHNDLIAKAQEKKTELKKILDQEDMTEEEEQKAASLSHEIDLIDSLVSDIKPAVKSIINAELTEDEEASSFDTIKETLKTSPTRSAKELLTSLFGSKKLANQNSVEIEDFLKDSNMDEESKALFRSANSVIKARELVKTKKAKTEGKSTAQVYNEVIDGGVGKKGLNEYLAAISVGLQSNNQEIVDKNLSGLKKFAARHTAKAEIFSKAMAVNGDLSQLSAEDRALLKPYNDAYKSKTGKDYKFTGAFAGVVASIRNEADALNKGVAYAEQLTGLKPANTVTDTITSPGPETVVGGPGTGDVSNKTNQASKPEPINKQEQVNKPKQAEGSARVVLKRMGFTDKFIKSLAPVKAKAIIAHENTPTEKLQEILNNASPEERQVSFIRNILAARGITSQSPSFVGSKPEIKTKPKVEPKSETKNNSITRQLKVVLEKIKDKTKNKHYSHANNTLQALHTAYVNNGMVNYGDGEKKLLPINKEVLQYAHAIYNQNFDEWAKVPDDLSEYSKEFKKATKHIIHTGLLDTLFDRLKMVQDSKHASGKYNNITDKQVFNSGDYKWTNQKEGSVYTLDNLCHGTSTHTKQALRQQKLPAAILSIGQKNVFGKSERIGDHRVAITEVGGKRYIVDMPQKEIFKPLKDPKMNTGIIVSRSFKPRFIEATAANMQEYYGQDQKDAEQTVDEIQSRKLEQPYNTVNEALQATIDETNQEYGTNLKIGDDYVLQNKKEDSASENRKNQEEKSREKRDQKDNQKENNRKPETDEQNENKDHERDPLNESDAPAIKETITTESSEDPNNKIKTQFTAKKSRKNSNLLQRVDSLFNALKVSVLEKAGIFTEKHPLDELAQDTVKSMQRFCGEFHSAFHAIYSPINGNDGTSFNNTAKMIETVSRDPKIHTVDQYRKYKKRFTSFMWKALKDHLGDDIHKDTIYPHDEIITALDKAINGRTVIENNYIVQGFKQKMQNRKNNKTDYRFKDPIQYLSDASGKPYNQVIDALAASAYEWLGTSAVGTVWNDDRAIKGILNLPSSIEIHPWAQAAIGPLGISSNYLVEGLGQTAYSLLEIEPIKTEAEEDIEVRLQESLGLQVIAAMQHMGLITKKTVYTGSKAKYDKKTKQLIQKPFGLAGYAALHKTKNLDVFTNLKDTFEVPENIKKKENIGRVDFYKLDVSGSKKNRVNPTIDEAFITPFKNSPHTWSMLFKGEPSKKTFSWFKFKHSDEPEKLKKTDFKASLKQTKMKNNHEDKARKLSQGVTALYFLLGEKNLDKIEGVKDPKKVRITNVAGVDGKNNAVNNARKAINNFLTMADKRPQGVKSSFYIREEFWRQGRMGEVGDINQQGNKTMRALFKFADWNAAVDLTNPKDEEAFMEAVAWNLDIETTKYFGMAKTIKAVKEKLKKPKIAAAIKTIQDIINEGDIDFTEVFAGQIEALQSSYQTEADIITKAVLDIDHGIFGLKGLLEYAKYDLAKKAYTAAIKEDPDNIPTDLTRFKTDLGTEIDGVGNGMMIGRLQLIGKYADPLDTIVSLINGGIAFSKKHIGLARQLGLKRHFDSYMTVGFHWANELSNLKAKVVSDFKDPQADASLRTVEVFHAFENLFGSFREEETYEVARLVRKLSKDPTMRTVFGMGEESLQIELGNAFFEDINSKIEKAVEDKSVEDLKFILANINTVLNKQTGPFLPYKDAFYIDKNGKEQINAEAVLKTKFTFAMEKLIRIAIRKFHGTALTNAIDIVYSSIQQTFKPLNTGVNLAAAYYNTARRLKIEQLDNQIKAEMVEFNKGKAKKDQLTEPRKKTIAEIEAIDESLKDMFPHIETYFGERLPMAKKSKVKAYNTKENPNTVVMQTYKKSANIPVKKAAPYTYEGVDAPGVAPTISTIHNSDSIVALTLMDAFSIINNHDGFTTIVGTGKDVANKANKTFYDSQYNFSVAEALFNGLVAVEDEYQRIINNEGLNKKRALQLLSEEMKKVGIRRQVLPGNKKAVPVTAQTASKIAAYISKEMETTAAITTKNKKGVMDAMTAMEQYSYPDGHYLVRERGKPVVINDIKVPLNEIPQAFDKLKEAEQKGIEIEEQADKGLKEIINIAKHEAKEQVSGNSPKASEMSTNPDDYARSQEISKMNVLEVYDAIKGDSTKIDSKEHDRHLRGLLTRVIRSVMQPLDLYIKTNPNKETMGIFDGKNKRVFISNQSPIMGPVSGAASHGIRMSTGETYTHELLHSIIETGMKTHNRLRKKVEALYELAYKELNKNGEGYRVFLNDPDMDVTDEANRFEVEAAQERFDYIFRGISAIKTTYFPGSNGMNPATKIKQYQYISNHLDEFITIGLTNENFMKYLSGIDLIGSEYAKPSWQKIIGANIQETLGNIFQIFMDFFYRKFTSKTTETNVAQELESLAVLLSQRDTKQKGMLYTAMQKGDIAYSKTMEYGNRYIANALIKWPVVKVAHGLKQTVKLVKESDTLLGQRLRETEYAYQRLDHGIVKSMVSEIRGRTDRLDELWTLLTFRNRFLDAAKQQEADTYINMCNNDLFQRDLTDSEKTAITKSILKSDACVLYNSLGLDGLTKILKNDKSLDKEINSIFNQINNHENKEIAALGTYYRRAADAMGYYMVHSRSRTDEIPFQNARIIAEALNTGRDISPELADIVEPLIDQLGSLYALKYTTKAHKKAVSNLIKEDSDGITGVLNMHAVLKEKALKSSFGGNIYQFTKGYIKQILNPRIGFKYGTKDDIEKFAQAGYVLQPQPIDRDPLDPTIKTPIYVYTSATGRVNDQNSSIASFTNNKGKGTGLNRIARQMGLTALEGQKNNAKIVQKKEAILQRMADPNFTPQLRSGNHMVPKVNDMGIITEYRYTMAETTKEDYLEQVSDYTKILGGMAAQVVDKVRTPQINAKLVRALKTLYTKEYEKNPDAYVEIGPESKDPRLQEIAYMLPAAARQEIREVWGSDTMYVAKDVVDLAFGYRNYSIVDAFTTKSEERAKLEKLVVAVAKMLFKDKAVTRMNTLENIAIGATKMAKSNIIVKSLTVTLGNFGSNLMYLKSRGVPISMILKLGWEAAVMGNKYQVDSKKLDALKLQRSIQEKEAQNKGATKQQIKLQLKDIDSQIVRLLDSIARNPVTKSIDSGLMPSLIDDVETITGGENFPTKFDKKMQKITAKLPSPIQNVGKVLFLAEDTEVFKMLNNAVKMTDFIGRHVLYNYYMQESAKAETELKKLEVHREKIMKQENFKFTVTLKERINKVDQKIKTTKKKIKTHKQAVDSAMDEFVNFDVPTHRMVEWGNIVGFLWFTKYGTRILKSITNSITDKPLNVFSTLLFSNTLGADNILNSTPIISKDMFSFIDNPVNMLIDSVGEQVFVQAAQTIL